MIICAMITLSGCSANKSEGAAGGNGVVAAGETKAETTEAQIDKFAFVSGDVTIRMHDDVSGIIAALGDPDNYAESPSCAFEGIDKIYSYKGFDIYTYPDGDKDFVNSVYFTDDKVSTPAGIRIGSTVDEVTAAYGDNYEEEFEVYTYTEGKTKLAFLTTDGVVDSIEYSAIQ